MQNLQSFFDGLYEADLVQINATATVQHLKQDDLVFAEGDDGECFYVIRCGRVNVFADENGRRYQIGSLGEGKYFGELSLFNNDKHSASVVAAENSTLLCLEKSKFGELIKMQLLFAELYYQHYSGRDSHAIQLRRDAYRQFR